MRNLLFLSALLFIASTLCPADTLELENGDRITGKLVSMNEDTVTVKAEYGTLVIKRAFIKKGLFAMQAAIPRQGLVLELLFSGNLTDTSGSNIKLANNGGSFVSGKDGGVSSAIGSDGAGKYASIAKARIIDSLDSFSISFWFTVTNQVKSQYLVSKWDSTTGNTADGKFAVLYKGGYVTCYAVDKAGSYYTVKNEESLEAERWNHVVFTSDMGNLTLTINGKKVSDKKYGFGASGKSEAQMYLLTAKAANDPKLAFYCTEGAIDNLRIYDRPLSEKEIAGLFAEFSGL
jgi:hypothetical protein